MKTKPNMKTYPWLIAICLLLLGGPWPGRTAPIPSHPADGYPVADIPPALLLGANAVVRERSTLIEVHGLDRATRTETVVITILNERARHHAIQYVGYDRNFFKPPDIDARLFDKAGEQIRKIRKRRTRGPQCRRRRKPLHRQPGADCGPFTR